MRAGVEAKLVRGTAKPGAGLKRESDLVAVDLLAQLFPKTRGKLAVGGQQAQAVRGTAEVARRQPQPAARLPVVLVEASDCDCIKLCEFLRTAGIHAPGDKRGDHAEAWFRFFAFPKNQRFMMRSD